MKSYLRLLAGASLSSVLLAATLVGCTGKENQNQSFVPGPIVTPGASQTQAGGSGVGTNPVSGGGSTGIPTPVAAPTNGEAGPPATVPPIVLGSPQPIPSPTPTPAPTPTPIPTPTPNQAPVVVGLLFNNVPTGTSAAVEGEGTVSFPYVFNGSLLEALPAGAPPADQTDVPDSNRAPVNIILTYDDDADATLDVTVENLVFTPPGGAPEILLPGDPVVQPLSETATVDPGPAPVVIVYNPDLDVTNDVPEPRIGTYTFQIVATDSEGEEERLYFVFSEVSSSIGTPTVPPFPTPTGGIVVGNCLITADPADPDPGEDYTVVVQVPQPFTTGDTVSGSVSGTDGFQENVSGTIDATGEARLSPQIPGAVAGVEDTITITTPSQCAGSAVLTF